MLAYITDNIKIFSDSDREDFDEENYNEENSDEKKILMQENKYRK